MRSDPGYRQLERNIVANQIAHVASALGHFDQALKLFVVGVRFNLKFYFNFSDVPFLVRPRMHRRPSNVDLAYLRGDSQRHQQASAKRAEERRHRIRPRRIVARQPPTQRAVPRFGPHRIACRLDDHVTVMRRFLRWFSRWHCRPVRYSPGPNLAETATILQTVRSSSGGAPRLDFPGPKYHSGSTSRRIMKRHLPVLLIS